MTVRQPPHSDEAEGSLLGALLLSSKAFEQVVGQVRVEDFYRAANKAVFEAISYLRREGGECDAVLLSDHLAKAGKLEQAGGLPYLISLANETPGAANAAGYARVVVEKSQLRSLIEIGSEVVESAYSGEAAAEALERGAQALLDRSGQDDSRSIQQVALEAVESHAERLGQTPVRALLKDAQAVAGPWMPSDLVVLAARPSMGKTAAAIQMGLKVAFSGVPVEMFSLEMGREQLLNRVYHHLSGIEFPRDLSEWTQEHYDAQRLAAARLKDLPFYVDDSPDLDPVRLRWKIRAAKSRRGVGLVILDYLQLLQPSHRSQSKYDAVSEASRACKNSAKASGLTVLALSQLSRDIEKRTKKQPSLSDLRESGQIEQDADQVVFLHSDGYYQGERGDQDLVEWIWAKNRHGRVGRALTVWKPGKQRFYDADPSVYQELTEQRDNAKRGPY